MFSQILLFIAIFLSWIKISWIRFRWNIKEWSKKMVTLSCKCKAKCNAKMFPHSVPGCFIGLLARKEPVTTTYYILAQKNRTHVKTSGKRQKSSIGDWLCTKPFLSFQKLFWGWKDTSVLKYAKNCKKNCQVLFLPKDQKKYANKNVHFIFPFCRQFLKL